MITEITEEKRKKEIARAVLEALSEWFGLPESTEKYIEESANQRFFAAFDGEKPVGFICIKKTGDATAEIAVMGVLKEYHRRGIGRKLFEKAKESASKSGFEFMQVKTVQQGRYSEYDATNEFYKSLGFREFELFPTLWDEWNPCQIYIMSI